MRNDGFYDVEAPISELAGLWECEDGEVMLIYVDGQYVRKNTIQGTVVNHLDPNMVVHFGGVKRVLHSTHFPHYSFTSSEYHAFLHQYDDRPVHTSTSWHSCHDNMLDFPIRLEEKGFEPWYVCKVKGCGKAVKKHEV